MCVQRLDHEAQPQEEESHVEGPLPLTTQVTLSTGGLDSEGNKSPKAPTRKSSHIVVEDSGLCLSFVARKGVYYDKRRRLWRANWKENGRIHTKGFSVHGTLAVSTDPLAPQAALSPRNRE